jgi:lysine biosynthesis protein LysW
MVKVVCPECTQQIRVRENPRIGGYLICDACGKKLEIVWLYPLEVEYAEVDRQTNLDRSDF